MTFKFEDYVSQQLWWFVVVKQFELNGTPSFFLCHPNIEVFITESSWSSIFNIIFQWNSSLMNECMYACLFPSKEEGFKMQYASPSTMQNIPVAPHRILPKLSRAALCIDHFCSLPRRLWVVSLDIYLRDTRSNFHWLLQESKATKSKDEEDKGEQTSIKRPPNHRERRAKIILDSQRAASSLCLHDTKKFSFIAWIWIL